MEKTLNIFLKKSHWQQKKSLSHLLNDVLQVAVLTHLSVEEAANKLMSEIANMHILFPT